MTNSNPNTENRIAIWCPAAEFGDFISGLLGKPQVLTRRIRGVFTVVRDELLGLHYIIEQRVHDQSEASLVQFIAAIGYDNGLSVEIGSTLEFQNYAEVRSLCTNYVTLTWIYLIKFQGRPTPERQQIEISFSRDKRSTWIDDETMRRPPAFTRGEFSIVGASIRISHSMRSWGMDLENLLFDHIKQFFRDNGTFLQKVATKRNTTAVIVGTLAIFSILINLGIRLLRIATNRYASPPTLNNLPLDALIRSESHKLDLLYSFLGGGNAVSIGVCALVYLIGSIIIALTFSIFVIDTLKEDQPSFIIFTSQDLKYQESSMKRYEKNIKRATFSFASALLVGILSNLISLSLF